MEEKKNEPIKVGFVGYASLFVAVLLFSGLFSSSDGVLRALDFNVLNGAFGTIGGDGGQNFRGAGGGGARDGFLFALTLMPAVIFALGVVNVVDGLGGLRAAQKIMTPFFKPLMGVPGICALANIANMQSTDAGSGMIKELYDKGEITDAERSIIISYQTSASAFISNYFSSGSAVFGFMVAPIILPIIVMFVFKVVGANLMRIYLKFLYKKSMAKETK